MIFCTRFNSVGVSAIGSGLQEMLTLERWSLVGHCDAMYFVACRVSPLRRELRGRSIASIDGRIELPHWHPAGWVPIPLNSAVSP